MAYFDVITTVRVEVEDIPDLFAAALARAVKDGMEEGDARDLLTNSDPLGRPDIKSCLIMLFDPGVSPDGTSISGTEVQRPDMDEDDAMDAYEDAHGEDEEGDGDDED
ncbi:hypothetical protein HOU02_gp160 [Caulobacter phage CcrBL9]|uniref:Uncharacterized protein n=1 Tax=Caulobacter phage CcrBL9 TaxID=2283270 RepID=A0A385EEC4_9CAUD|nr:hypothetical protein HOU02_gp025 [Caulobacter phage CcrBL9]YP_009810195.1 hypothetical protein HOU02_gp160 [Caulobacter phage CcrBL9]AXQ69049.1 hypothetical protein CcrBL9_gp025 [Caulobacter phage CcrBL9]AXQ69565.1 hypothetical protein CcrBL9_gp541 [Caulobacter phage CcrBL9]